MTRQRWEDINSNLHLVDNSTINGNDKIRKIRMHVDQLRQEFQKVPMLEFLSVDEQMVRFKGASSIKQYVPKKPHKWGYKIFLLADGTGAVVRGATRGDVWTACHPPLQYLSKN